MSTNKKVLVVDDDAELVESLASVLNAEGYDVVTAHSQKEAEEVLLTVRPDLGILGLMMEQADSGFVLAYSLKKLYPETPIILLSSVTAVMRMSFDAQSPEAKSWLKMDRVLDKPVRPEQLKEEVHRLLKDESRAEVK